MSTNSLTYNGVGSEPLSPATAGENGADFYNLQIRRIVGLQLVTLSFYPNFLSLLGVIQRCS